MGEARNLASFVLPMLRLNPEERVTARQCLEHPWLRGLPCPAVADEVARASLNAQRLQPPTDPNIAGRRTAPESGEVQYPPEQGRQELELQGAVEQESSPKRLHGHDPNIWMEY